MKLVCVHTLEKVISTGVDGVDLAKKVLQDRGQFDFYVETWSGGGLVDYLCEVYFGDESKPILNKRYYDMVCIMCERKKHIIDVIERYLKRKFDKYKEHSKGMKTRLDYAEMIWRGKK